MSSTTGADGQPDFRMNFKEGFFEIWHLDRWYRAGPRATEVDDHDGRFVGSKDATIVLPYGERRRTSSC